MTTTSTEPRIVNGVNVDQLYGTLDLLKEQPGLGTFQFRAANKWINGPHNRTTIQNFYGAGQTMERAKPFTLDAGEPAVLLGEDQGPNPAEFILHALAACLTTSLVYVAAARGVELEEVESTVEGDINVLGALGLDDDMRNGYEGIRVSFRIKSNAPAEKVQQLIERAQQRSAVFDIVTHGVPVTVTGEAV